MILDRKKMNERIMTGEASLIFLALNGNMNAELLCDVTQPEMEQQADDFLREKYATLDPVRQYAAVRVWNEYLKTSIV